MMAHIVQIDKDDIRQKVMTNFSTKRINQSALLNAMDVNLVNGVEHPDQRRHLTIKEAKVSKLEPWLDRVKKKETCLRELNDEAAKIKVLDVEETSTVVDNLREYLKDY